MLTWPVVCPVLDLWPSLVDDVHHFEIFRSVDDCSSGLSIWEPICWYYLTIKPVLVCSSLEHGMLS